MKDLPAQFKWVASAGEVNRNQQTVVEGNGAIITVGQVRPQPDGTVQVTSSIYLGPLASGGQTYVLERQDGKWKVTGTTGRGMDELRTAEPQGHEDPLGHKEREATLLLVSRSLRFTPSRSSARSSSKSLGFFVRLRSLRGSESIISLTHATEQ